MGIDAWVSQRDLRMDDWIVLGRKISGIVSWNMNDTCNYRCSYCTQRHMPDRSGKLEQIDRVLSAWQTLPGCWEFKLSGGEPFQQPGLDQIASGLIALGHCISVQTNLSATPARLTEFLEATRGALNVFSASLHLEYATPESFLEKYDVVREYEPLGVTFHVTTVAKPDRLVQLRDEIEPFFRRHGIPLKVQPEKVHGYVRDYAPAEQQILLELGGHNQTGEIANNFQGRLCYAGANYLVVKSTGEVYRCYPASRVGGRYARLGSLEDGFTLLDGPRICPYTYCNCTVPIQRGMIQRLQVQATREPSDVHTLSEDS